MVPRAGAGSRSIDGVFTKVKALILAAFNCVNATAVRSQHSKVGASLLAKGQRSDV